MNIIIGRMEADGTPIPTFIRGICPSCGEPVFYFFDPRGCALCYPGVELHLSCSEEEEKEYGLTLSEVYDKYALIEDEGHSIREIVKGRVPPVTSKNPVPLLFEVFLNGELE